MAAAAALQTGDLAPAWMLTTLTTASVTRGGEQLQQRLLADYYARRDADVDERLLALSRWARRRADPAGYAAAYDEQQLLVCDVCAIAIPRPDHDAGEWLAGEPHEMCRQCGTGQLISYAERDQVPTLDDRLTQLRHRLDR